MNIKVRAFCQLIDNTVDRFKAELVNDTAYFLEEFKNIKLSCFDHVNPYSGPVINNIFFVYCDHYHMNKGDKTMVQHLNHPHKYYEDRGYIKGVQTDLNGYVTLKAAAKLNANYSLGAVASAHMPVFVRKDSEKYYLLCQDHWDMAENNLNLFIFQLIEIMNTELEAKTGLSLLNFVRNHSI